MKDQNVSKYKFFTFSNLITPLVVAIIFFAFTFLFFPFREKIQFDGDEGLNLMRSMLVGMGHPLYVEVSSDQPPLFTQLLVFVFRITGYDVTPARLLVLLFATLLVWSCSQFLKITWGNLAAILFLPLMIMAPRFLDLSVAVMIGVPALAMASLSLLLLVIWHKNGNKTWLVFSGFAMAFSVLIKLFTGFLVPIIVIGILVPKIFSANKATFQWKLLLPVLIWLASFGLLTVTLVIVLVGFSNLLLIITPHIAAINQKMYQDVSYTINNQLQAALPLLLLGLFGSIGVILKKSWLSFYLIAWIVLAYIFLCLYTPVLFHHQLLITIPAAMLAAVGISESLFAILRIRKFKEIFQYQNIFGFLTLITLVFVSTIYLPVVRSQLSNTPRFSGFALKATAGKIKVIHEMNKYVDQTHWIVTDMPMYAFIVNRPVPPILATYSRKRLVTGSLTTEDIISAIRDYHPEQVLIGRFVIPEVEAYLKQDYTLVATPEFFRLFIRNEIIK